MRVFERLRVDAFVHARLLTRRIVIALYLDIVSINLYKLSSISTNSHMTMLHITVQRLSSLVSLCNGVNGKLRSGKYITADKDILLSCLIGQGVRYRSVASSKFYLAAFEQIAPYDSLTYGKDNVVTSNCLSFIFIVYRIKFFIFIIYR